MKKRNQMTMTLGAALLALALVGTACSDNGNSSSSPSASPSASASPTSSATPDSENQNPEGAPEQIEATGKYVGLQDSHSIEIETAEGPMGFQVGPEIVEKVGDWEENTPVKFQYIVEKMDGGEEAVEQKTIVSIDKE
ncbi:hypothetical protein [Cohnella hongkongensis]|uniref:Lipoprotein n=1 Tax=Cohnella hongkongensis TaxID=178337 RepID=A0ABV9FLE3_9BACL